MPFRKAHINIRKFKLISVLSFHFLLNHPKKNLLVVFSACIDGLLEHWDHVAEIDIALFAASCLVNQLTPHFYFLQLSKVYHPPQIWKKHLNPLYHAKCTNNTSQMCFSNRCSLIPITGLMMQIYFIVVHSYFFNCTCNKI